MCIRDRHYSALEPLLEDVGFDLLVPGEWPEGLPEFLRFQRGFLNPDGSVQTLFLVGPLEISLLQVPVSDGREIGYSGAYSTGDGPVHSQELDVTTHEWNGVTVTWQDYMEGMETNLQWTRERGEEDPPYGSLMWEQDGVSYKLDGQNMTFERAETIFKGLVKAEAG